MKKLIQTSIFKKDLKDYILFEDKMAKLEVVLELLRKGQQIPLNYRPHRLKSDAKHRIMECHIGFDLLLIWTEPDSDTVMLLRFGTHTTLFDKRRR